LGDLDKVSGYRANMDHKNSIEFEDSGVASLKMSNGMIGGLNWSVNSFENNMEVSLTILAEYGSIRIAGEYMNKVDYETGAGKLDGNVPSGQSNDYGFYKGSMSNHDKVYDNLVKALEDDQHPFTSVVDGLKTVKAIEQIYSSVEMLTK
jgi:UDP-N-acetyl-2-amino-2-deoxyglucuronate dehydrogenase